MSRDAEKVLEISQAEPAAALEAAMGDKGKAERSGDMKAKAIAAVRMADALSQSGKAKEAMEEATAAVDLCEELRFDAGRGAALCALARICAAHGGGEEDAELGFDSAQDALRLFRKSGEKKGEGLALWSTAQLEVAFGKPRQAIKVAKEALMAFREVSDSVGEAAACQALAVAFLAAGETSRARQAMGRALAVQEAVGNKRKQAACWHALGSIPAEGAGLAQAVEALGKARAMYRELGDTEAEAAVLATEREVQLAAGNFAEAVKAAKEGVAVCHGAGDQKGEGLALLKVCELFLENNDVPKAAKVVQVATDLLSKTQDRDAIIKGMEMGGAVKHAMVKQEMQGAIEATADFMHVPTHLIVDPGLSKRVQDSFQDALRAGRVF